MGFEGLPEGWRFAVALEGQVDDGVFALPGDGSIRPRRPTRQ